MGFALSVVGVAFAVMPLSRVLPKPDFIMSLAGYALLLLGIFFTIEMLAKDRR
jgi:hypothetical protein